MREIISLENVRDLIFEQYPEINLMAKGSLPSVFIFSQCSIGYYFSIKIPSKYDEGKAIHINVRCRILSLSGIKDYNVYPLNVEKMGRGHFISKSIAHTENWRNRLIQEINTGIEIYRKKFNRRF